MSKRARALQLALAIYRFANECDQEVKRTQGMYFLRFWTVSGERTFRNTNEARLLASRIAREAMGR